MTLKPMTTAVLGTLVALSLTACGGMAGADSDADGASANSESTADRTPIADIDFGTDGGDWANDDECDDPRFTGDGMTSTPLLDADIKADATDCREAYEKGELTLK